MCQVVGCAAGSLGRELFAVPGLARALRESLLCGLEHLPDHRLRGLVRAALRPLLHHCPPAHLADVAVPVLDVLTPFSKYTKKMFKKAV